MWTSPDGDEYEVRFNEGKMCGEGTLTDLDGAQYEGQFYEGMRQGTRTYPNEDTYEGQWHEEYSTPIPTETGVGRLL